MEVLPWTSFDLSRLQSGPLFAYVGAGLSMGSGLVGWNEMAYIIWRYRKYYERERNLPSCPSGSGRENSLFLRDFVRQTDKRGKRILSRQSDDPRAFGRAVLLNLLLRYRAPRARLVLSETKGNRIPEVDTRLRRRFGEEPGVGDLTPHALIWDAACQGVLTPNYDMLLEHAYSLYRFGAALRSYRYTAEFLRYILSNRHFVLKLHGDINDIGSMVLDPEGAWDDTRVDPNVSIFTDEQRYDLQGVYAHTLRTGHMIYVGFGFRDRTILELHRFWRESGVKSPFIRVALVPEKEIGNIQSSFKNVSFDDVCFLTYPRKPGPSHAVRDFLREVRDVRAGSRRTWFRSPEGSDIRRQVFCSLGEEPRQIVETKSWTCKGIPVNPDVGR